MENPHYYVPAGLPPGEGPQGVQEGPPAGVYYYRIYGGLMALLCALLILTGLTSLMNPLLSTSASGGAVGLGTDDLLKGILCTGFGSALFIPFVLSLVCGRRPWVHTLGTVLIAITMLSLCCMPVSIPILISWLKPETKNWYGAS